MKYLLLILFLFSGSSFSCDNNENDKELKAFAELDQNGFFEIYVSGEVRDDSGRLAKIDSITLHIKGKFYLLLKVEDASFDYKGYFVSSGMLNQNFLAETTVIINYDYGDLSSCSPQRFHNLQELFDVEKPVKVVRKAPPQPQLPPHFTGGA